MSKTGRILFFSIFYSRIDSILGFTAAAANWFEGFFLNLIADFLYLRSLIFPTPIGRSRRMKAHFNLFPW